MADVTLPDDPFDFSDRAEPWKVKVTVRMIDGSKRTYLVNHSKSVNRIWKALARIFGEPPLG